jgi:hypothetical protein
MAFILFISGKNLTSDRDWAHPLQTTTAKLALSFIIFIQKFVRILYDMRGESKGNLQSAKHFGPNVCRKSSEAHTVCGRSGIMLENYKAVPSKSALI